ncbi:NACHT protein; LRR and PYD domains-containing protein 1a [Camelus dromedarius]|uniref:NACHT protein n=1 Tax=Camelus dromedarius TaxID=9838 RepID=A0A5N4EJ97_CAMDR|nr:NACHT protein; LRR and PYD domains-containing protein 1a [Camelus dromedarius]
MHRGSRLEGGAGGPRRVGDDDGLQKARQSQAAWRGTEVPHRETVKVCAGVSGGVTGQEGVQVHACDDHSASSEEKGEDSSSESSSESESDNEEPKPKQTNGELGESSTEEASTQVEEWEDKGLPTDHFNSEFNKIQSHCEHCKAENKHNEPVTPRLLSRGQFLLKVDTEGIYQCTETGLIFEVNRKVDIKYCVLSWSKYADLVVKPWVVGGPLFDVKCDPTCLTSIQFPHSLCLGHCDTNMMFKVLHVKSTGASLEYTVDHSATHVKWRVSSLSPVGPVIQSEETVFHHGAVILYKAIDHNPSLSFRVYIATNNESFIKDISKSIKHSSKKFMKVDKPPVCLKLLQNGKKYRLISEPEAEITPEGLFAPFELFKPYSYMAEETDAGGQSAQATYPGSGKFGPEPQLPLASKAAVFPLGSERLILGPPKLIKPWPMEIEFVDGSLLKLKSYIEVYLEQPVEFKLLLVEMDSEEIVWKAKLREFDAYGTFTGDWIQQDRNRNISKSSTSGNRRRKMSSSLPDEVVYDKRMKQIDTSDGAKTKALLTDTQLISLAEKLGQEWVKIAIANLKLKISDIDAIMEKKEDVTMNKFRMLKKWQEKEQSNATAQNLCNCLKNVDSVEVQDVLRGFLQET